MSTVLVVLLVCAQSRPRVTFAYLAIAYPGQTELRMMFLKRGENNHANRAHKKRGNEIGREFAPILGTGHFLAFSTPQQSCETARRRLDVQASKVSDFPYVLYGALLCVSRVVF